MLFHHVMSRGDESAPLRSFSAAFRPPNGFSENANLPIHFRVLTRDLQAADLFRRVSFCYQVIRVGNHDYRGLGKVQASSAG